MTKKELRAAFMVEVMPDVYVTKHLLALPDKERRVAFQKIGARWADLHRPPRKVG